MGEQEWNSSQYLETGHNSAVPEQCKGEFSILYISEEKEVIKDLCSREQHVCSMILYGRREGRKMASAFQSSINRITLPDEAVEP